MKTLLHALLVVLTFGGLRAYSQSNGNAIISRLRDYDQKHISEKAYLHFDKPYYAAGDTIYFKAYVTMGERHLLSQISGVLHIDLINTRNKIDQSINLQLNNGLGWGDFALPDSLPKGNYRVRAYTQWMHDDSSSFFEKMIPIGSQQILRVPESAAPQKITNVKPDIQFFPESGELISGIDTKVAFKAVGTNGLAIELKGKVTDNTGKEVASFSAVHLGMGYFWLKPEAGKSYRVAVTFGNGAKDVFTLPQAIDAGIGLTIDNDSLASATIKVEANEAYFRKNMGKEYSLLIYSGGRAVTVTCRLDTPVIKLQVIKRRLSTGIVRATLFSENEPLCERIFFVQNFNQLNLSVKSDKAVYSPREKVNLTLNARTRADFAAMGFFSVSITDENQIHVDENAETSIMSHLLLTSELKGYVEQPNYYFKDINEEKLRDLDLVMLTHGYRHFEWKKVLNDEALPYKPERAITISGTAENLLGKPLAKATVTLIPVDFKGFISDTTDNNGHFRFSNLVFTDSARFVLQAVNAKGKNRTKLTYDQNILPPVESWKFIWDVPDTLMRTYLQDNQKQLWNNPTYIKSRMLKEVKIKAVKRSDDYPSSNIGGPGHADQVMRREQLEQVQGQLAISLSGRLVGVKMIVDRQGRFHPYLSGFASGPMLVVVDGVEGIDINNLSVNEVETVEVLRFAGAAIYGMQGGNGVLVVTTKQGAGTIASDIKSIGVLPITVKGFYKAREFYSPKYNISSSANNRPDLRSTVYWKPNIVTDKDGNASIEFYNTDGRGSYRVVIEGIDNQGNLGRQVYRYIVE